MLPIMVACNRTYLVSDLGFGLMDLFSMRTLFFIVFCTSATVVGSIVAYWLGRFGGKRAVKWIAGDEEEFDKWTHAMNGKVGKGAYALTVLLPIFPDDLLCIVVGAMRMDFLFFVVVHVVGSLIGMFTGLFCMRLPYANEFFNSGGESFPTALLVYSILTIVFLVATLLLKKSLKKNNV